MSGITGILHDDSAATASPRLLGEMCDRIIHRGPDGFGQLLDGPVALSHRRLSIVDVSGGAQPIFNEDRSIAVVFNGEIYNHKALRQWLTGLGHHFRTTGDTEVLVHAYEHEGPEFVRRLRGMFAFALWDAPRRRLMIARDRLGKKPLYYTHQHARLLFASELKALLADKSLDLALDYEAFSDYLSFTCIPAPKTPFQQVRKLPPAHYLLAEGGQITLREYWDAHPSRMDVRAQREIEEELFHQLDDAVACRLQSEVPLGAFLSGGVDSSTVVALMSRHGGVKTTNIGFDVEALDESKYAEQVATLFKTDHRSQRVKVDAASEDELERLVWHLDEPFGDPSAIPTHRVSGVARKSLAVALSGDGADEVFAGHDRYRTDLLLNTVRGLVPGALRSRLLGELSGHLPGGRLRAAVDDLAHDLQRAHFRAVSYFRDPEKTGLFTPELRSLLNGYDSQLVLARHHARVEGRDPLAGILYVDLKTCLPDRMLLRIDRMAMMHSLEVRSPFLDQFVVEMGLRIPAGLKIRDGQGKWILKKAMERVLPNEILYRRKQGFDVPLAEWFRGPVAEPLEAALGALGQRGYLRPAELTRLYDEHRAGAADHAQKLWMLYMLELWHRVFRVGP